MTIAMKKEEFLVFCYMCGEQKDIEAEFESCTKCGSRLIVKKKIVVEKKKRGRKPFAVDNRQNGPI